MDTYMSLTVYGDNAKDNINRTENLIKELDARFGVNSKNGEVFALNTSGSLSEASDGLVEMIACARLLYERTNGAYDITAKPLSELWGFINGKNRVPSDAEIGDVLRLVGMEKLTLDGKSVALASGTQIDLGSCAKGYAAREAAKLLKTNGVLCAVLSLGGNVQTVGQKPDGSPFAVAISDPREPSEVLGVLKVGESAIVTSGTYQRYFESGGNVYHHIFDATTGKPCDNGLVSVTVVCDDGLWADALSTSLFLLGKDGALDYYENYGGFEAIIVSDNGTVTVTDGIKNAFELTANGYVIS